MMTCTETTSITSHSEPCTAAAANRVAAMLDLQSEQFKEGQVLPRGWQFILLAGETKRSALRSDGFPGLGVNIPDLGLPRLLLSGREVEYCKDIRIGASVERKSRIEKLQQKEWASGPGAVITLLHQLYADGEESPSVIESQTYVMLPPTKKTWQDADEQMIPSTDHVSSVKPDETLLFQYCALCFNSHKIHLNRTYAQEIEGYPDLIVNGGLSTLLMTEFLRRELKCSPAHIKAKYLSPLFADRTMTITADRRESHWELKAYNDRGNIAVIAEVVAA